MNSLATVTAALNRQPTLNAEQRATYEKIQNRITRADREVRRATKHADATALAKATVSMAKARAARDAFVADLKIADRYPPLPERIRYETRSPWSGPGINGIHVTIVEMRLDHIDVCGPYYVTTKVLTDIGGPPTNARSAPDSMGCAWFAVKDLKAIND